MLAGDQRAIAARFISRVTEIRFTSVAGGASAAIWYEEKNGVITGFDPCHPFADFLDDTGGFVPRNVRHLAGAYAFDGGKV